MPLETLAHRFETTSSLDPAVDAVARVLDKVLPKGEVLDALRGRWLGHPLHPLLTDLPIGFWTSAFVLDLGGRRTRTAADAMVTLGVVAAVPTVVTGWAEWPTLGPEKRRSGLVHAAANAVATGLFARSALARFRGERRRGVTLQLAGSAVATFGGFLGGHLAFGDPPSESKLEG